MPPQWFQQAILDGRLIPLPVTEPGATGWGREGVQVAHSGKTFGIGDTISPVDLA